MICNRFCWKTISNPTKWDLFFSSTKRNFRNRWCFYSHRRSMHQRRKKIIDFVFHTMTRSECKPRNIRTNICSISTAGRHRMSALKFSEIRFIYSLRSMWKSFERVWRVVWFSNWKQWMSPVTANIPQPMPMPIRNRARDPFFCCSELQWNHRSAICGNKWCPHTRTARKWYAFDCNRIFVILFAELAPFSRMNMNSVSVCARFLWILPSDGFCSHGFTLFLMSMLASCVFTLENQFCAFALNTK